MQGAPLIQMRSLQLLRTLFAYYPSERPTLLEELFSSLLPNLPVTGKRAPRVFQAGTAGGGGGAGGGGERVPLQMASALMLLWVQSAATLPLEEAPKGDAQGRFSIRCLCFFHVLYVSPCIPLDALYYNFPFPQR
jgi:hypothetical protein